MRRFGPSCVKWQDDNIIMPEFKIFGHNYLIMAKNLFNAKLIRAHLTHFSRKN